MRTRWWPALLLVVLVPGSVLLLLLVPAEERAGSDGEVLRGAAVAAALIAVVVGGAWLHRGSDSFTADEQGLRTCSRRRGNRVIAWSELRELGWVVPGGDAPGGLAGRRHEGGLYEPGGPAIAGWLSQPIGRVRPDDLDALRALCERHGVAWRDYASAEVM